jgi:hypothetical protein
LPGVEVDLMTTEEVREAEFFLIFLSASIIFGITWKLG